MNRERITACGECCDGCPKRLDGQCPGCLEADGRVPEWAQSGQCRIHACAKAHGARFCGACKAFPCEKLESMMPWKENVTAQMQALRQAYEKEQ